jgi:ubiquitin
LTLPCEFSFEAGCNDVRSIAIFNVFIHPCILPAEFCGGRQIQSTFENYQPNMMARQLGCGQVPPRLFLHEFLKPREDTRNPYKQKGSLSISAAQLFMHPGLLCQ